MGRKQGRGLAAWKGGACAFQTEHVCDTGLAGRVMGEQRPEEKERAFLVEGAGRAEVWRWASRSQP